jgi:hypothetical protein
MFTVFIQKSYDYIYLSTIHNLLNKYYFVMKNLIVSNFIMNNSEDEFTW